MHMHGGMVASYKYLQPQTVNVKYIGTHFIQIAYNLDAMAIFSYYLDTMNRTSIMYQSRHTLEIYLDIFRAVSIFQNTQMR